MKWFFAFFFVSGFCSLLYELVWLRLAMAQFGVTSAVVSIVLSAFMAGLGLGSWGSGLLLRRCEFLLRGTALQMYATSELLIGISAILVPHELSWGGALLQQFSISSSWSYYVASASCIAVTLVPWCACMGATIPIAMLAIREHIPDEAERSFSFLYLANVFGAVLGAMVPLLFIELYGFHTTLKIGAILNAVLAVSATLLASRHRTFAVETEERTDQRIEPSRKQLSQSPSLLALLFATGFTSMGLEVAWIRQFTPYLGTVVYAFASILSIYLLFTFVGSRIYRCWGRSEEPIQLLWTLVGLFAIFSSIAASPQFHVAKIWRLLIGTGPFSAMLGFVTPLLVDRWAKGDPDRAGRAYAINVLGCIIGPLVAGFVLLPVMSERWTAFVFAAPWLILGAVPGLQTKTRARWIGATALATTAVAIMLAIFTKDYETQFSQRVVLRDHTADVIATQVHGRKLLLVNGVGITALTPITKMMAHLPLASLEHPPQNALVVCFGMGTTYRSLLSWNIHATAVELVPSVPRLFWYYHSDGPDLLLSGFSHLVIDDGRRYLERTSQKYDVITIDPPPPVEAAGSSLLYSKEFYSTIKERLQPGGILQQWLPYGDATVQSSVARALAESFSYTRVFHSVEGAGFHFLASGEPVAVRNPEQLVERMPASAVQDLIEWGPAATPQGEFALVLNSEFLVSQMIAKAPEAPALQDDRPTNEYYWVRRTFSKPRDSN